MNEVRLSVEDGVATLTLDRPDRLNAYDLALAARLRTAVGEVEASGCDVLVIAASGRAFCAGGDVREMASSGDPAAYLRTLTRDVHAALAAIRSLPCAVVARVHGSVAGGGLGLVLAADVVLAADTATFAAAYGALGLSPDCGVTALLPGVVGSHRARDFLLRVRRIDARTARDWGLVSEVVAPHELDGAVAGAVAELRTAGRTATRATKMLLDDAAAYARQLDREAESIAALAAGEAGERIAAFAGR